ncbi:MAG: hypothetical protein B7Y15_12320 [Bacteroidetes bacterium 24-39-8]|nr:MAG: hypothetical protein B7Y15_12320 [Bacteroidetes bacterium 24-39-8]HQS56237.1 hypothetical protein [Sediminibacterium sp.]
MLIYTGGYQLISACYRMEIHAQMASFVKLQPADKAISHLSFKTNKGKIQDDSFVWREENREFTYQGYMYDIISMVKTDTSIVIKCYFDKNETELEQNLVQLEQQQHNPNSGAKMAFHKLVTSVFLPSDKLVLLNKIEFKASVFTTYQEALLFRNSDISLPPPDRKVC